jgi:hypothetical protein
MNPIVETMQFKKLPKKTQILILEDEHFLFYNPKILQII